MSVSLIESDFAELQKLSLSDLKIRFTLCKALSLQFRLFSIMSLSLKNSLLLNNNSTKRCSGSGWFQVFYTKAHLLYEFIDM